MGILHFHNNLAFSAVLALPAYQNDHQTAYRAVRSVLFPQLFRINLTGNTPSPGRLAPRTTRLSCQQHQQASTNTSLQGSELLLPKTAPRSLTPTTTFEVPAHRTHTPKTNTPLPLLPHKPPKKGGRGNGHHWVETSPQKRASQIGSQPAIPDNPAFHRVAFAPTFSPQIVASKGYCGLL